MKLLLKLRGDAIERRCYADEPRTEPETFNIWCELFTFSLCEDSIRKLSELST
jgi:hypothetical protein